MLKTMATETINWQRAILQMVATKRVKGLVFLRNRNVASEESRENELKTEIQFTTDEKIERQSFRTLAFIQSEWV